LPIANLPLLFWLLFVVALTFFYSFCRELHKNESSRIMGENVELIKEINDLRRENRSLKASQGRDEPGRGNSQELLRELVRYFVVMKLAPVPHASSRKCSERRYGGCGTALTCLRDRVL